MNQDSVEKEILELTNDDDYGLWEIIWQLNGLFPTEPASERKQAAEMAVRALFAQGRVALFVYDSTHTSVREVAVEELDSVLADNFWEEPIQQNPEVRVTSALHNEGDRT